MYKGIVISFSHNNFIVENLDTKEIITCQLKGNLKNSKIKPICGDLVSFSKEGDTFLIFDIKERKNQLIRPRVANIDRLIIVQSSIEPKLNISQLYKYIAFYNSFEIYNVIIAITKTDLDDKQVYTLECLEKDGFKIFDINKEIEYENLLKLINDGLTVFIGQSGVGKSSLLNKIDDTFLIRTSEISKALNRGKHTTTSSKLHKYQNGYLIDTPGFSSFEIECSKSDFTRCFKIFNDNAHFCRFQNCTHIKEPSCAIKKLVEEGKISSEMYSFYKNFLEKKED